MITALVQFRLPQPVTREKAQQLFVGSAPKYREASGLIRKYYLLSEDGGTAGGVYLWKSKKDAAGLYTKEWENVIRERYGAQPTVTYFESPVVVDNLTNEIISDSRRHGRGSLKRRRYRAARPTRSPHDVGAPASEESCMQTDRYGYELSTQSSAAAEHWVDGADRFLAADGGSLEAFERAIAMDGDFALAHAGRARVLALRGAGAEARSAATRAMSLAANATSREQSHVAVIHAVTHGDSPGALARIHAHVNPYPRDAFALQPATNVFGLIGLSGRRDREQEVFDLLAPLAGDYGDDWWYVGTLGFWHTELGRIDDGLRLNRQSIEANPRNGNAVHGLAHAWYETGDDAAGTDFLESFLARYPRDGALHCHLNWHLALVSLRGGNVERMWKIFIDGIKPGASTTAPPLNTATDTVALLWHAQLFGHLVEPNQWADARAFVGERFPRPANGFLEAHRAIACAMAGDSSAVETIVKGMRDADATGAFPWGTVLPDAIEGMAAFARGDDPRAIELLLPRIDEYVRIGGSHAQRDLFRHTLVAACLRDGRLDAAREIAERIPWRVDRGAHALIGHHARSERDS